MSLLRWRQVFHQNLNRMKNWVKTGLIWGCVMFILVTFVSPYLFNEEITLNRIIINIFLWLILGLLFGYSVRKKLQ